MAERLEQLDAEWVIEFFDKLEGRSDLIHLGIGSPSFDTPEEVKSAAYRAIAEGKTKYTPSAGIKGLREAIAERYEKEYGCSVNHENVIVTPGASSALFMAFAALLREGDHVLLLSPSFPSYAAVARILGVREDEVVTKLEGNFKPRIDEVAEHFTESTKLVVVNNPCNPTGAVYDKKFLRELVELSAERGAYVLSDEVYENYVYDGEFVSLARYMDSYEKIIVVNSFSKTYSMTGWRIGYMLAPSKVLESVLKLQIYINACPPSVAQYTVLYALDSSELKEKVLEFREFCRKGRDVLCGYLRDAGMEVSLPEGGFYVFPKINVEMRSDEFCRHLLEEEGVVAIPGSKFGSGGEGHFRLTFAVDHTKLAEAGERISRFVAAHSH